MPNQINLINPSYRKTRHPLNAVNMLLGAALLLAGMFAWGLSEQAVKRGLDARSTEAGARHKKVKDQFDTASAALKKDEPNKVLVDEVAKLDLRLRIQREVLTALETGGLGSGEGFSRYLTALARQRIDGVWLTKVSLSADNQLSIGGRMTRAELLPQYIRLLNKEDVLRGRRFGELRLIEKKETIANSSPTQTGSQGAMSNLGKPITTVNQEPSKMDVSVVEFELGAAPKAN